MNYEQFINDVQESIKKILGDNFRVSVHKVLKNNDIELEALTITERDSYISPTIYLNQYFTEYKERKSLEDVINEIICLYEEHRDKMLFDVELFKDYSKIKEKIAFKLVNARQNEKLLKDVPYIPLLDLAIVFYCMVDSDHLGNATAMIHHSHMEMWGVEVSKLYELAVKNTPRILDYELRSMNDILKEMLVSDLTVNKALADKVMDVSLQPDEIEEIASQLIGDMHGSRDDVQMYVLTNKQKINGAACMLYDGVLKEFANEKEDDIYILPSSIHEVILVPGTNDITREQLNCMVREVNSEEVDAGDILSDHVYMYRRDTGQIYM